MAQKQNPDLACEKSASDCPECLGYGERPMSTPVNPGPDDPGPLPPLPPIEEPVPPIHEPDRPVVEPDQDRLPDEEPLPNPDENPDPPQRLGSFRPPVTAGISKWIVRPVGLTSRGQSDRRYAPAIEATASAVFSPCVMRCRSRMRSRIVSCGSRSISFVSVRRSWASSCVLPPQMRGRFKEDIDWRS